MLNRFFRQFSGPSGPLGQVAGRLMARMNGPLNDWVVDLLELSPRDRVLEVGFGPGLAVERIAARTNEGLVVGVDHSELMWRHAAQRNRSALASGRVELKVGTAGRLPLGSARFTHALAVNSLQFWPDLPAALAELRRVLVTQGRLVLALRMRRESAGRFDRSRHGMTEERLAQVVAALQSAGFRNPTTVRCEIRGETLTAILARAGRETDTKGRHA
jgi:ubiquinone/menaquinone biosynthesis C-methylase UbiE